MSTKKKKRGQYIVQDEYFLKAKKLGYRARSAFKLLELQEKFSLIRPGMTVLDIASAPGSFLQVISRIIGSEGMLIGVDIQRIVPLGKSNVRVIQESIFEKEKLTERFHEFGVTQFDVITSDIAPATTGMTGVDQYRSIELNIAILDVADVFLQKGGTIVLKVFVGEDVDELVQEIKKRYTTLKRHKPDACRDRSFEEYFVCIGKK